MNMDLKTLHYFKKVAELQHMTKAADELYVSQAHLSRIIAALEEEVGVPLFDRTGRGIQLNSCGILYYNYVNKILALLDESIRNVRDEYSRSLAELTIASNTGAYMPPLFQRIQKEQPDFHLKQYSLVHRHLLKFILSEKADFNIICPPSGNLHLMSISLHRETAVVIYPPGHWLEDRTKIHLNELEHEDFVGANIGYGARDSMELLYVQYHFQPNFVVETTDTSLVKSYVLSGMGVAVVPKTLMIFDSYFQNHYCEFEEDLYGDISLEWRRDRELSEDDIRFCNITLKYFHELSILIGTATQENVPVLSDFQPFDTAVKS